jgi:hypothetical protein
MAASARAEGDFTNGMSTEEQAAAGLGKLTQNELARLKAAVERYKDAPQTERHAATAGPEAAQNQVGRPSAQAVEPEKKKPGWLTALITLQRTTGKPGKAEAIESQLVGDFGGWNGHAIFTLENGQRWKQANTDRFNYTPAVKAPKVKIYPGALGTFWMEFADLNVRCRVQPLQLE